MGLLELLLALQFGDGTFGFIDEVGLFADGVELAVEHFDFGLEGGGAGGLGDEVGPRAWDWSGPWQRFWVRKASPTAAPDWRPQAAA